EVVEERAKLRQALIKDKRNQNLVLLPAAQTRDKHAVSIKQMKQVIEDLQAVGYTYVLTDGPAGLEQGVKNARAGPTEPVARRNRSRCWMAICPGRRIAISPAVCVERKFPSSTWRRRRASWTV